MYSSNIFIVSKRKELAIKHKKALETSGHKVFIINSLPKMFEELKEKEPELIIISDTIYEDFVGIIKQIKVLTYNYSPVIIAISRSSNLDDKLIMLQNGADDCFGEEITNKELIARINAYIRRYVENSLNQTTGIIGEKLGLKHIKRVLENKTNSSIVLIEVQNSEEYKEIYGEIAYGKVMQTIGAIINSTLGEKDFISHFTSDRFVLITEPIKAEKMSSFLAFAFDNMIDKFYSETDFENKFIKYFSDNTLENKIPLMKLNIGIINLENDNTTNEKALIAHLNSLIKMCRKNKNSTYIIDRIKLKGKTEVQKEKNRILIIEKDEALSYLIQTACELKGLKTSVCSTTIDFDKNFEKHEPDIVILDYEQNSGETLSIDICKKIKNASDKTKVIFTSSKRKKTEILASGADLYLPKPYEINTLLKWIEKFLKED